MYDELCKLDELKDRLDEAFSLTQLLQIDCFGYTKVSPKEMERAFLMTSDMVSLIGNILYQQKDYLVETTEKLYKIFFEHKTVFEMGGAKA